MNKHVKRLPKLYFIFFAVCAIIIPLQTSAVGISPGETYINNLANGLSITRSFTVSRSDTSKPTRFVVELFGDSAKYLKLESDSFTIPAGELAAGFSVRITPVGAPNGSHIARLAATSEPLGEDGDTVQIRTGVIATIYFEIVDREVRSLVVTDVITPDTEVGSAPFVSYYMRNDGNVFSKVERIEIRYTDVTDESNVFSSNIEANSLEEVSPLTDSKLKVEVPLELPLGSYRADYKFFFDGSAVFEGYDSQVRVWPQGTLAQSAEVVDFKVTDQDVQVSDLMKIEGVIKNTGEISIKPKLIVDIEANGKPVDFITSEEKTVFALSEANYILTFRPNKAGNYTFKGFFEYGPRNTNVKEYAVVVSNMAFWYTVAIAVSLVIVIGVVVAVIIHLRRKKHNKHNKAI